MITPDEFFSTPPQLGSNIKGKIKQSVPACDYSTALFYCNKGWVEVPLSGCQTLTLSKAKIVHFDTFKRPHLMTPIHFVSHTEMNIFLNYDHENSLF